MEGRDVTLDDCDLADFCVMPVLFLTELFTGDLLVTDERVVPDLTLAFPTEGLVAGRLVTDPDDLPWILVLVLTELLAEDFLLIDVTGFCEFSDAGLVLTLLLRVFEVAGLVLALFVFTADLLTV